MVGQIPPPHSNDDAERNADTVLSRQLPPLTAPTGQKFDTRGHVIRTTKRRAVGSNNKRRDAAMRRSRHAKAGMGDGYLRLTDQAVEIACCDPRRERSHVTVLVP
jgi:hypothetical protein